MTTTRELEPAADTTGDAAPADARRSGWWQAGTATVLSAALLWFGTGLTPVAALTWFAPLPIFLLATRLSGAKAVTAAAVAWFAGGLTMWTYYTGDLQMPFGVVLGFLAVQAALFAGTAGLFRHLTRRGSLAGAAIAAPAAWACGEYLLSLVSPGGAFTSLASTQAQVLPVIQLASATGVWGVSFVLLAVPACLGALCSPSASRTALLRTGAVLGMIAVLTVGYGSWQLRQPTTGAPVTVALVDVRQPVDSIPLADQQGAELLDAYLAALPAIAAAGASIAVLPEKVLKITEAELATLSTTMSRTAAANHLTVVIGLTLKDSSGVHNIAMAYTPTGATRYDKQHLVPGWEDHVTPGNRVALLPGTAIGLIICKDLDHPETTRAYAGHSAGLMLAPALDVDRDGRLHSRIASLRGVESGMTIVRAADHGRLTASDPHGRFLADVVAARGTTVTLTTVSSQPRTTLYAEFGDWFAWLCLALIAGVLLTNLARPLIMDFVGMTRRRTGN